VRGCRSGLWNLAEVVTTHEHFVENQSSKLAGLEVEIADEVSGATEAKEVTTPMSSARAFP
jgi:Dr1-associated corepressor